MGIRTMKLALLSRAVPTGILFAHLATAQTQGATAAIDVGTKYQTIRGFGASTAWGSSFSSAGDPDLLWSTTKGAGLSLHRIRIDPSSGSTSELAIAQKAVSYGVTVWATPWTPPAADKSNNNTVMGNLTNPSAYATYLPSQEPGHVEIRTISGRLLESRAIPVGASEAFLGFPTGDGIYLARVIQGGSVHTAKLFQPSR